MISPCFCNSGCDIKIIPDNKNDEPMNEIIKTLTKKTYLDNEHLKTVQLFNAVKLIKLINIYQQNIKPYYTAEDEKSYSRSVTVRDVILKKHRIYDKVRSMKRLKENDILLMSDEELFEIIKYYNHFILIHVSDKTSTSSSVHKEIVSDENKKIK